MGVTVSSARSKLVHTITVILYTAQKQLLSIVEQYCVQVLQQIHSDQMKTMFFKCYIHYCMHTHVYRGRFHKFNIHTAYIKAKDALHTETTVRIIF